MNPTQSGHPWGGGGRAGERCQMVTADPASTRFGVVPGCRLYSAAALPDLSVVWQVVSLRPAVRTPAPVPGFDRVAAASTMATSGSDRMQGPAAPFPP